MYFYDILEFTPIIMPRTKNKGGQKNDIQICEISDITFSLGFSLLETKAVYK